jgi:hypothetical protein
MSVRNPAELMGTTATNNEAADAVLKLFNLQINIFVQERNRLAQLLSPTLPNARAVWDYMPTEVQDSIKKDMAMNIKESQLNIDEVLSQIDRL